MSDHAATLRAILEADPTRSRILALVGSLGLPDCWVAAGFVRNAVWDYLHARPPSKPAGDVDVVWFDADRAEDRAAELELQVRLRRLDPTVDWSVRNQARMHRRNGDAPYVSVFGAMCHWPETATAVAVRLTAGGGIEIAAPFGLSDLFALVVQPTPGFRREKHRVYLERVSTKRWLEVWPKLRAEPDYGP